MESKRSAPQYSYLDWLISTGHWHLSSWGVALTFQMVSSLPFRITLVKSQTDHSIPKLKSGIWFPVLQTLKTLFSSTQFTQSELFFLKLSASIQTLHFLISCMFPNTDTSRLLVLRWPYSRDVLIQSLCSGSIPMCSHTPSMAHQPWEGLCFKGRAWGLASLLWPVWPDSSPRKLRDSSKDTVGTTHERSYKLKQKKPVHKKRTRQGSPSSTLIERNRESSCFIPVTRS